MSASADIPNILAIDFGTSRIKAAAWDPVSRQAEVFSIGQDEKSYIPALFHLDQEGDVTFGEAAGDLMVHDPLGALENVKLHLDRLHRTANGQKTESTDLLKLVFEYIINKYVGQSSSYHPKAPLYLVLTLPSRWNYQDIYTEAATKGTGLPENQLAFVKEPIAAAFQWIKQEQSDFTGYLVVIDVGGGTVDWACVQVSEQGIEIVPECPPAGIEGAGFEVDKRILDLLEKKVRLLDEDFLRDHLLLHLKEHKTLLLEYVRKVKERNIVPDDKPITFNIAGHKLVFEKAIFEKALLGSEIERITQNSCKYIAKAATVVNSPLTCVIIGAGSRLPVLKQSLTAAINHLIDDQDLKIVIKEARNLNYATALGAIYYYLQSHNLNQKSKLNEEKSPELSSTRNAERSLRKRLFDEDKF